MSRAQYLQMIGRAGRAGKCPVGEAFLVLDWDTKPAAPPHNASKQPHTAQNAPVSLAALRKNELAIQAARRLLAAPMPQLTSNLVPRGWVAASDQQRQCAPSATQQTCTRAVFHFQVGTHAEAVVAVLCNVSCLGIGKKAVRCTELLCRAWKEAGLEPVKKLVLECMMLQPLSARGMVKLLTTKTLAAAEVQAVFAAQRKLDLPSKKQAMQALADCGFAALKRLNKSGMVSNFKDEGEQGADAISLSFTLVSLKTKVVQSSHSQ